MSYYVLRVLSWVGLARDLRTPPKHVLDKNRIGDEPIATDPDPEPVLATLATGAQQ